MQDVEVTQIIFGSKEKKGFAFYIVRNLNNYAPNCILYIRR
jgi:hypothetical protein